MMSPWQCYVHAWLIYLLGLVFQLSWWLMCFGYWTYSESLNLKLMRLCRRWRPGRRDLAYSVVCGRHWQTKNEPQYKNTRLLHVAFIKNVAFKEKHLPPQLLGSSVLFQCREDSLHWIIILQRGRIIYIIVHVCNSFCSEADVAPAAWRTFRWNGKHCRVGGGLDRTGGGKRETQSQVTPVERR